MYFVSLHEGELSFPDLFPKQVNLKILDFHQDSQTTELALRISEWISAKVFLNYVSQIFNVAPTKVSLFLVDSDE